MLSVTPNPGIPFISTEQMREVDRAMMEDYTIDLVQMMENAGRELAHLARGRFLGGDPRGQSVAVLAGTGGNGGGGLVCARRLSNWGADVTVWLSSSAEQLTEVPRHQLSILQRMGVPVNPPSEGSEGVDLSRAALCVDALIGYSLSGPPRGAAATLIRAANAHDAPVLALDAPSGVDTTTGTAYEPVIRATATMTLALPKEGLRSESSRPFVGELYLADISIPPQLYTRPPLSFAVGPIFAKEDIVRLW